MDPKYIYALFVERKSTPAAPPETSVFKFPIPGGASDSLIAQRWLLWNAIAQCGIFPWQLYVGTDFAAHGNCAAGMGSPGQCVIYTKLGTLIWLPSSGRLYTNNPSGDLLRRLQVVFPPYHSTRTGPNVSLDFSA
jgi:hypothetical protein